MWQASMGGESSRNANGSTRRAEAGGQAQRGRRANIYNNVVVASRLTGWAHRARGGARQLLTT